MLGVNLRFLRTQLLETVDKAAQSPSPFAIGSVVLQLRIETVEIVLSPFVMLSPLSVVVHLLLVEHHRGDGTIREEVAWQGNTTCTNHQGVRGFSYLGITDDGTKGQGFFPNGNIHHESRIALHVCFHLTGINRRFLTDAPMLNHGSDFVATAFPVAKVLHTFQGIGQLFHHRQLLEAGLDGFLVLNARVLSRIYTRLSEGKTTHRQHHGCYDCSFHIFLCCGKPQHTVIV